MIILGAGMAGCIAGVIAGDAQLYEASGSTPRNHEALLRFRTENIARITGIDFREVKVLKGIWYEGQEVPASPRMVNLYSQKVVGVLRGRSVCDLAPVNRYIAPENFPTALSQILCGKIHYGKRVMSITPKSIIFEGGEVVHRTQGQPIISTLPMPLLSNLIGEPIDGAFEFNARNIRVTKARIAGADVHQTIYYPDPDMEVYRASMTGDLLTIESMDMVELDELKEVLRSFGLSEVSVWEDANKVQPMGKIVPISEKVRKDFMFKASSMYNVWSLGRYACWRNILLDDVYHDMYKIKKMIGQHVYNIKLETY